MIITVAEVDTTTQEGDGTGIGIMIEIIAEEGGERVVGAARGTGIEREMTIGGRGGIETDTIHRDRDMVGEY